jgi:hypothetical protein
MRGSSLEPTFLNSVVHRQTVPGGSSRTHENTVLDGVFTSSKRVDANWLKLIRIPFIS